MITGETNWMSTPTLVAPIHNTAPQAISTATHLPTPPWYPPIYGTSQWTVQDYGVQTMRETGRPTNNYESSQFETMKTYNDSIRRAPQLSNLRWAIAPGSLKHLDRVLDSPQFTVPGANNVSPLVSVPGGSAVNASHGRNGVPNWMWTQNVVGVNNQLLDVKYGSLLMDAYGSQLSNRVQPMNWNVNQPGQPYLHSATAAHYAVMHR